MNKWNEFFTHLYAENASELPENLFGAPMGLDLEKIQNSSLSLIIFGDNGTGKTTLAKYLSSRNNNNIILHWHPRTPQHQETMVGSELSWYGFQQILNLLAVEIIPYLGNHPAPVKESATMDTRWSCLLPGPFFARKSCLRSRQPHDHIHSGNYCLTDSNRNKAIQLSCAG